MKHKHKHKHAEYIIQWANGIACEAWLGYSQKWVEILNLADFNNFETVRLKPEPKPDFEMYACVINNHISGMSERKWSCDNLKLIFDGETNALKDAKVIK